VGEAVSVLPLLERIRETRPGLTFLVTTGTVTSARLMADRLPDDAVHQYVPLDRPQWVRAFLGHWRPDLALWVESEFWPILLSETRARGIPAVLVNARISPRSFAKWRRAPGLIRELLASFALCLAQDEQDAAWLRALGAAHVRLPGNLKFAGPPPPADFTALAAIERVVEGRPCWLAASTHRGEEDIIATAHSALAVARPGLLTIVIPRHPTRGPEIAAMLRGRGLKTAVRSADEPITPDTAVYLADTMGELGVFYRLSNVAFVGGSLVVRGGQNVLEAAKLGCAIVHGPHMENFRAIAAELGAAGASATVHDAGDLAAAIGPLLDDPVLREQRGAAALRVANAKTGILDAVLRELGPFLDALPATTSAPRHARA
jgi:3-deoxy-D-manno-octulosonic-acid transferase